MSRTNQAERVTTFDLRGGILIKGLDSLFILRPTLMFPLWTMLLAGCRLSTGQSLISNGRWALLTVGLSAIFGLVYLVNQITDKDSDRQNNKLFLVSEGIVGQKHIYIEAVILAVGAPLLLFIGGFEFIAVWALGMLVFAGLFYSYKPVALQRSPIGGIISGLIGGWMLVHVGGILLDGSVGIMSEIPYLLAFTSSALLTGLLDIDGDRDTGKLTFVVVYGQRATIIAALAGIGAAAITGIINGDWVITAPALLTVVTLSIAMYRSNKHIAVMANKLAIFSLTICVGINYPIYILVVVLYFMIARWYYSKRFGLNYPSFAGV